MVRMFLKLSTTDTILAEFVRRSRRRSSSFSDVPLLRSSQNEHASLSETVLLRADTKTEQQFRFDHQRAELSGPVERLLATRPKSSSPTYASSSIGVIRCRPPGGHSNAVTALRGPPPHAQQASGGSPWPSMKVDVPQTSQRSFVAFIAGES